MAITDTLRRAPRWAWYVVAGVGVGAGAIKLYADRDKPPPDPETTDPTTEVGASYPAGPGSGMIVPPVVIPPAQDSGGMGLADLQSLYIGSVENLVKEWGTVYGPIAGLLPNLVLTPDNLGDVITSIANAGGTPPPVTITPTVVVSAPPPAFPTPQPIAAPAPYTPPTAPVVVASAPQNCGKPWGCGPDPCTGDYPYYQDTGARKGQCYTTFYNAKGKHFRRYKNGDLVQID